VISRKLWPSHRYENDDLRLARSQSLKCVLWIIVPSLWWNFSFHPQSSIQLGDLSCYDRCTFYVYLWFSVSLARNNDHRSLMHLCCLFVYIVVILARSLCIIIYSSMHANCDYNYRLGSIKLCKWRAEGLNVSLTFSFGSYLYTFSLPAILLWIQIHKRNKTRFLLSCFQFCTKIKIPLQSVSVHMKAAFHLFTLCICTARSVWCSEYNII